MWSGGRATGPVPGTSFQGGGRLSQRSIATTFRGAAPQGVVGPAEHLGGRLVGVLTHQVGQRVEVAALEQVAAQHLELGRRGHSPTLGALRTCWSVSWKNSRRSKPDARATRLDGNVWTRVS